MDKFAAFAQCLEDPFLALRFRQDAQERQAILAEHGFNSQESQAVCDGVLADSENQIAELFGHNPGKYMLIVMVVDAMPAPQESLLISK
jgi:hypothetical protein